jgi:glycosyltransferase involved in cell wall biosynthesis
LSSSAAATSSARRAPGRARLLIVGPLPPPIGGVETFTQALLESNAFRAFEVEHCDITKGRPKETQGRFDLANFAWAARHAGRLRTKLARFRPDVVYLPIAGTWSGVLRDLMLATLARRSGARVLGHQHDGEFASVLAHRGPLAGAVRHGLAQFDRMLVLGERWRTLLTDYGLTLPIDLCPSTYRREVVERARGFTRTFADGDVARGLFVGQLGERKGVPDLLSAIARLKERGVAMPFAFVGPFETAAGREAVVARRRELNLESDTELTGTLQGEALYQRFATSDLFVLPSYTEGLPVVLYEAGAFQLPVITTPVGSIPDFIEHERNGLLIPPGDVEALTDALARLAREPELRRRLGTQLAADVASYHPDRIAARVAEAVDTVLAGA